MLFRHSFKKEKAILPFKDLQFFYSTVTLLAKLRG